MHAAEQRARAAAPDAATPQGGSGRIFTVFLMLAVVGLSVIVLMLVRSNADLRNRVVYFEQELARERTRDSLATGDQLSPITTLKADGTTEERTFRGKPAVIFLIASKCPYCEETIPLWREAIAATRATESGKVDLLTIQTDAKRADQLRTIGGGIEPRCVATQAGTWVLRVPVSPGAMLVDGNAVVRRTWFGMPSEKDKQELVQALLGVMPER